MALDSLRKPKSILTLMMRINDKRNHAMLKLRLQSKWNQFKYGFYFHRSQIRWEQLIESWFVWTMVLLAVAFNLLFIATWVTNNFHSNQNIDTSIETCNIAGSNTNFWHVVDAQFPSILDICSFQKHEQNNENSKQNQNIKHGQPLNLISFDFCKCIDSSTKYDLNVHYDLGLQCAWIQSSIKHQTVLQLLQSQTHSTSNFVKYIENKIKSNKANHVSSLLFQTRNTTAKSLRIDPAKLKHTEIFKHRRAVLSLFDFSTTKPKIPCTKGRHSSDEKRIMMDCAYLSLICALFQFCLGMCRSKVLDWIEAQRHQDKERIASILAQWTTCTLLIHKFRIQQCVDTVERISQTLSRSNTALQDLKDKNEETCDELEKEIDLFNLNDEMDDGNNNGDKKQRFPRKSSLSPSVIFRTIKQALQECESDNNVFNFSESIHLPKEIEKLIVDFTWKRKFDATDFVQAVHDTQTKPLYRYISQFVIFSQLAIITIGIIGVFIAIQWILKMHADDAVIFVIACQIPVIWFFVSTFLLPEFVSG